MSLLMMRYVFVPKYEEARRQSASQTRIHDAQYHRLRLRNLLCKVTTTEASHPMLDSDDHYGNSTFDGDAAAIVMD